MLCLYVKGELQESDAFATMVLARLGSPELITKASFLETVCKSGLFDSYFDVSRVRRARLLLFSLPSVSHIFFFFSQGGMRTPRNKREGPPIQLELDLDFERLVEYRGDEVDHATEGGTSDESAAKQEHVAVGDVEDDDDEEEDEEDESAVVAAAPNKTAQNTKPAQPTAEATKTATTASTAAKTEETAEAGKEQLSASASLFSYFWGNKQ